MSRFDIDDFDDDEFDENDTPRGDGPKPLREQLKALKRQVKQLSTENAELKGTVKQRVVGDVLKAKGLDPKVAELMGEIDPTAEAVEAWLAKYPFLATPATPADDEADAVSTEDQDALGRIQDATDSGKPPSAESDWLARLNSATTPEEVAALSREIPGVKG